MYSTLAFVLAEAITFILKEDEMEEEMETRDQSIWNFFVWLEIAWEYVPSHFGELDDQAVRWDEDEALDYQVQNGVEYPGIDQLPTFQPQKLQKRRK